MTRTISLKCRDRISTSVIVRISVDKTIKDLKLEIARCTRKEADQIILRKGKKELVDVVDIDTYELMDGECIEIEYK